MKNELFSDKAEYRRNARACLDLSTNMRTEAARAIFADLADHWTRLAEYAAQAEAKPAAAPATVLLILPR